MLWTDAKSREFIAKEYPWFLDTYDDYRYTIQRADAIRYFVLHHYGGIYLDVDMGCLRPMDALLSFSVILPKTIPVGISNDLMLSEKGHPFMAQTIHNLMTFDISWYLNYPTVMFSTGPMFLSAQYGVYTAAHPFTPDEPGGDVRILPRALYGKHAKPGEAPDAFFTHAYASSWHDDDASFINFLGVYGKTIMWFGLFLAVCGVVRLTFPSHHNRRSVAVVLPRWSQRRGRWYLGFGDFSVSLGGASRQASSVLPPSPTSSMDEDAMFTLSIPLDEVRSSRSSRAVSPAASDRTDIIPSRQAVLEHPVVAAASSLGRRVANLFGVNPPTSRSGRVLFTVRAPPSGDDFHRRRTRSPPPVYSSLEPSVSRHGKSASTDDEAERGEARGLHPREGYVPSSRAVTPSGSPDPSRPASRLDAPPEPSERPRHGSRQASTSSISSISSGTYLAS
jgi:hypothetical protein